MAIQADLFFLFISAQFCMLLFLSLKHFLKELLKMSPVLSQQFPLKQFESHLGEDTKQRHLRFVLETVQSLQQHLAKHCCLSVPTNTPSQSTSKSAPVTPASLSSSSTTAAISSSQPNACDSEVVRSAGDGAQAGNVLNQIFTLQ